MVEMYTYKFRLYPTKEQAHMINKTIGCARLVYNELLARRKAAYELTKETSNIGYATLKADFPFLAEVDSLALSYAKMNLDTAYKNFFRRVKQGKGGTEVGFPQFKKYHQATSYQTMGVRIEGDCIRLPKIGFVPFVQHREMLSGALKTVTVSRTPSGKYFASILVRLDEPYEVEVQAMDKAIGIDLGLSTFAVLSDGTEIEKPLFYKGEEAKLAKAKRVLSRRALLAKGRKCKLKDAKNYQKQKRVVARLEEKVANKRKYFIDTLSADLLEKYDLICIEDLGVKEMQKDSKLARNIADASWYEFCRMLEYKAEYQGKKVIKVAKDFPSTQLCSCCGAKVGPKGRDDLGVRIWRCGECSAIHSRDLNAAKNILNEGLRIFDGE